MFFRGYILRKKVIINYMYFILIIYKTNDKYLVNKKKKIELCIIVSVQFKLEV